MIRAACTAALLSPCLAALPCPAAAQEISLRLHDLDPPPAALAASDAVRPTIRLQPTPRTPAAGVGPGVQEGPPDSGTSTALLVGAGVAGGAMGVLAGSYLGAWIGHGSCRPGDECFSETLSGAAVGLAVGESLLLSLGVHLANRRRGRWVASAATAAGLAVGGLGLLHLTHYDRPWAPAILVGVPVLQLGAAVTFERR